jgi:hypothetical protein
MDYVFGTVQRGPKSCVLTTLQGIEDDYELHRGISRINGFPEDAYFRMDDDFPRNLQLEDFLLNQNALLVISDQLKIFLEAQKLKNNEFLPVHIVNHKGRKVKEPYYIFHQVELQDCIDVSNSDIILNAINPETFSFVYKLIIDKTQIDPEVAVFRMKRYAELPIFRRDLAERIQSEGFTGIRFGEIEDWDGG